MKLGDRVKCSAYVKSNGAHYELEPENSGDFPSCYFWEDGATEGVEVEDFHTADKLKTIDAEFSGIFVGTTTICTKLSAEHCDDPYKGEFYRVYSEGATEFAVVYYASNRKRLVPMDRIAPDLENLLY